MSIDQIVVLLVFIGFCIGGAYLAKKANQEMNSKTKEDNMKDNDKQ
ncbi:MAG: hypothetical protein JJT76_10240 [Clostridiaceae bacterium]|nr:hypothetical protein [Clostridiaceae bacterium]